MLNYNKFKCLYNYGRSHYITMNVYNLELVRNNEIRNQVLPINMTYFLFTVDMLFSLIFLSRLAQREDFLLSCASDFLPITVFVSIRRVYQRSFTTFQIPFLCTLYSLRWFDIFKTLVIESYSTYDLGVFQRIVVKLLSWKMI